MRRRPLRRNGRCERSGFTLIEVLIALAIIGFVAALAVPALIKRLDAAFRSADLAQVVASAALLPVRAAAQGVVLTLDAEGLTRALPDGQPPLDLPPGWRLSPGAPTLQIARGGTCTAASVILTSPPPTQQWELGFEALSCRLQVRNVGAGP